jgi:hypothetical protein
MWEDPILAELEQTRAEILAEFGGDFDAYLEYLGTREAENRRRGLRYAVPPTSRVAASPCPGGYSTAAGGKSDGA